MRRQKRTDELINELKQTSDATSYVQENADEINSMNFAQYVDSFILDRDLHVPDVIRDAQLDRSYAYQIIKGERNPSRDKIIQLCFGLHLKVEEAQYLLEAADKNRLYPRKTRDALLINALEKNMTVLEADAVLEKNGEDTLL